MTSKKKLTVAVDSVLTQGEPAYLGGVATPTPVGIATEDSRPVNESDGGLFDDYPDGHIVNVMRTGMVSGTPPYASGVYVSDANTAMKTLPRLVQRIIYRYAKWRLK